jgi:RNA polymerase sigma-70 factor (ECF subfamily)
MDGQRPASDTVGDRRGDPEPGKVPRSVEQREERRVGVLTDHRAEPDDDLPPSSADPAPDRAAHRAADPAVDEAVDEAVDPAGDPAGPEEAVDGAPGDPAFLEGLTPAELRADFGDHFEAHYQRLVAQLYAITLNPAEAHDVVREAYSRAWRRWSTVGASPDPAAWVRRVAVRSTMRSWRRVAGRIAPGRLRRALVDAGEPRTRAMLLALGRLPDAERRAVVLVDMAATPVVEVAALEQVPPGTVAARLSRARQVVGDALVELDATAPAHGADAQGDDW